MSNVSAGPCQDPNSSLTNDPDGDAGDDTDDDDDDDDDGDGGDGAVSQTGSLLVRATCSFASACAEKN